jgi:MFS transporter, DHA2 family, multidrug resistance protein
MLATIMVSLDSTIANVALPHIRGGVSATQEEIAWVLTSYMLTSAIGTPLCGWLSGRIGRKAVLLVSIVGFTIISAACGVAGNLFQIVLFRALQGLFGASLIPLSQAILLDTNRPEDQGRAMAIWASGVMIAPIAGPIVGGWLTDNASWRWIFYINLPIGLLAGIGVLAFVGESTAKGQRGFDVFGFSTLSLGVGALQLVLDRGQSQDWMASPEIRIETVIAGLSFYVFAVHTAVSEHSFLNRELLRDRNFLASALAAGIVGLLFNATLALLPTLLHDLQGYPAASAGFTMASRGIGSLVAFSLVGRLIRSIDARLLLVFGLSMMCWAQATMTGFSLQMDTAPVVWSSLLQGVGIGFTFVPLSTLAFTTVAPRLRTEGTAVFTLIRTIGASIGISITEALLARNGQFFHAVLVEHLRPDNPLARPPFLAPVFNLTTVEGLARLNEAVTRQAMMLAYLQDFRVMLLLSLMLLVLVPLLRKRK